METLRQPRTAIAAGVLLVLASGVVACGSAGETGTTHGGGPTTTGRVARVADGDTIDLTSGQKIRLVQIDAPEIDGDECYGREAARALRTLLPKGSTIGLEADPRLDQVDRFGRLLRYVWRGNTNLNVELVREGAATVYLYHGDRGRYAARLLSEGRRARAEHRGLWGACRAIWDPYRPATTYPR